MNEFSVIDNRSVVIPLLIYGDEQKELVRVNADGSVCWKGRQIECDEDFKAAMLQAVGVLFAKPLPA